MGLRVLCLQAGVLAGTSVFAPGRDHKGIHTRPPWARLHPRGSPWRRAQGLISWAEASVTYTDRTVPELSPSGRICVGPGSAPPVSGAPPPLREAGRQGCAVAPTSHSPRSGLALPFDQARASYRMKSFTA